MWVKDEISLRINLIKVNEEKSKDENDNENMIITNLFNFLNFLTLKRLAEGFNSKSDRFLSYLTIMTWKIKSSFFNKR